MNADSLIYIAGHKGMVGSAILRNLQKKGYNRFVLRSQEELDLGRQQAVEAFFRDEKPEYVVLAAAKVGGIVANNTYRAEFLYENLMIQNNVIHSAYKHGVKKLLFLGSSCIYPRLAPQPLKEEYLLTGPLEYTNEPYAIAKIAGIKMCENYFRQYGAEFLSVMPTNLYGPNDNYHLEKSHVLPALIRKMHLGRCLMENNWHALRQDLEQRPIDQLHHEASEQQILSILQKYGIEFHENKVSIRLWGSGQVYREFLHVDDMADACVFVMENLDASHLYLQLKQTHLNIGTGQDLTIKELAGVVQEVTGFMGELSWDTSMPEGTPRKQLDVSRLESLSWKPSISLEQGIRQVYASYKSYAAS